MSTIASLEVGQHVYQYNSTLWGTRGEWETVAAVRRTRDGLIEVELRKGAVLVNLLRASPETVVRVQLH